MVKYTSKVVLLGDGAVGKTSLVRRYVDNMFSDDYIATIGVNVKKKTLEKYDMTLQLWDIYGQKSVFPGKHSSNYTGAEAAMVVFDITRLKTFINVKSWISGLYKITGKIPVVLLGNKVDVIKDFEKEEGIPFKKASRSDFHQYMVEEHYVRSIFNEEPEFRPVPLSRFKEWAKEKNPFNKQFPAYLTSAKTGKNVDKAFDTVGKLVLKNKIKYR
ncbi:MAG: GTP-binding protein [Thermoplasmata archaeon]